MDALTWYLSHGPQVASIGAVTMLGMLVVSVTFGGQR